MAPLAVLVSLPPPFPNEVRIRHILYIASIVLSLHIFFWKWLFIWIFFLMCIEFLCHTLEENSEQNSRPTKGKIIQSSSKQHDDDEGLDRLSSIGPIYKGEIDVKSVRVSAKQFAMYRLVVTLADPLVKWEVWRRYSEFSQVRDYVLQSKHVKRLSENLIKDIESLPKKTLWRRLDEKHLTKRKQRLQIFASALLQDEILSNCEEIRYFFGVFSDRKSSSSPFPRNQRVISQVQDKPISHEPDYSILGPGSNSIRSMWQNQDSKLFKVRAESYLEDRVKEFSAKSIGRLVHCDLYKLEANTLQDHALASTINLLPPYVNTPLEQRPFIFAVQFQVPGNPAFSCIMYFAIPRVVEPGTEKFRSLLNKFIQGDDEYRNERFKLIPSIVDGPTIVKSGVGSMRDGTHAGATPALIGKKLQMKYFITKDYIECDINISSNSVANYLTRISRRYSKSIIVDLAFTLEGRDIDELPERIIGVCRFDHLDMDFADEFPTLKVKE